MNNLLKTKVATTFACVICFFLLLLNKQNIFAFMPENNTGTKESTGFTNQYDDVFDGYANMEITMTGRVGYNYAISLPNQEDILFGFDPRNTTGEVMDFSGIGSGWKIKLPFLDTEEQIIAISRPPF